MEETSYASAGTEEQLETLIKNCPNILGDDLLVIDRQRYIENVGFLDLLCLDGNGTLILVELKRDRAPREAVAQALDYASWLNDAPAEQIRLNAEEFLKSRLDDRFSDVFGHELEELNPENHKILLVAARLDAGAERIISYLARKHSVDINAVFFKYSRLKSGEQILVRTVLVPDEVFKPSRRKWTSQQLLELASEKDNRQLVDICRSLVKEEYLWEEPASTYGGSLRLWGHRDNKSKARMVTGLNVAGDRYSTPKGQLDTWIPVRSLAEVSGQDDPTIRKFLQSLKVIEVQSIDVVIRLASANEAERLVIQMKEWLEVKGKGASGSD